MELVADKQLQEKNYIFTHNYSSPTLFKALLQQEFSECGTVSNDRKGISLSVQNTAMKKGEVVLNKNDGVLALKWHYK